MWKNRELVQSYLSAVEQGAEGNALDAFLAPSFMHHELPNRLFPEGALRDLDATKAAAVRGKRAVRDQRYNIQSYVEQGDEVALEIEWTATLNVPLGKLSSGDRLRARIATFLTLRDGKIVSQRNYDCYDPF